MSKTVLTERVDDILIVMINRPHRKNAVDGDTARTLYDTFKAFDADDSLNIAILTGTENQFCSGADLHAVSEGKNTNPLEADGDLAPMGISRLNLSKPVIAAIEGFAVAGGLELALWCDLRVMADNATVGVFCRRFGVPLIDGGTVRLPRLIGESRAMDLVLTGRPVDAEEALHIGLVNRITGTGYALEEAIELAREITAHPQTCMRNDRLSLKQQWSHDVHSALTNEFELGLNTLHSGETQTGADLFAKGHGRHGEF